MQAATAGLEWIPARARPDFTLEYHSAAGTQDLGAWLALPTYVNPSAPPLIAIHGIRRCAREQAEMFAPRAAAQGRAVIAPLFDARSWPRYQQVVGRRRADQGLLDLLSRLRRAGVWRASCFELAGFSGGAQFAHRFAMLYPELLSRLTVASAGWYTFPDTTPFPYGLASLPVRVDQCASDSGASLEEFLRLPIVVCVGEYDCIVDANTRSGPAIDRQQGRHRLERARRWTAAVHQAAIERGIDPRVALHVLPDCGHSFRACAQRGGLDRLALPGIELRRHAFVAVEV